MHNVSSSSFTQTLVITVALDFGAKMSVDERSEVVIVVARGQARRMHRDRENPKKVRKAVIGKEVDFAREHPLHRLDCGGVSGKRIERPLAESLGFPNHSGGREEQLGRACGSTVSKHEVQGARHAAWAVFRNRST